MAGKAPVKVDRRIIDLLKYAKNGTRRPTGK